MAGEYIEFNNSTQPAVNDTNLNRLQQLIKQDIQGAVSGDTLPVGAIMPFGSDTIPENWLLCDGSAVSRTTYQYLFNTIGTTYGSGDGFTTFNLPDLRGKVVVGLDSNDTSFDVLGETGGEKEHTLTVNEIPQHRHSINIGTALSTETGGYRIGESGVVKINDNIERNSSNVGGSEAHNILQPYIVQNYIIKAAQSSGVVATVVDNLNSTSSTDALSANQGKILKELLKGTVLYENATGTTGNITLLDNSENYNTIEIFYTTGNRSGSVKVQDFKNNQKISLNVTGMSEGSFVNVVKEINISGTSIIKFSERTFLISGAGSTITFAESDSVLIKKVIGYNY